MPGYDVRVLDDEGRDLPAGEMGSIMVKLPLPPGCLPTLWNNEEGYRKAYLEQHPGYYVTSDGGYRDEDGYLWIMGRIDDVINVAGHRLSTGAMEEVLAAHPAVAECAVLGVADELKGQLPLGLIVVKAGVETTEKALVPELVGLMRQKIGPVADFKQALLVKRLPKTRSGKILRGTVRSMADGTPYKPPPPLTIRPYWTRFGRTWAVWGTRKHNDSKFGRHGLTSDLFVFSLTNWCGCMYPLWYRIPQRGHKTVSVLASRGELRLPDKQTIPNCGLARDRFHSQHIRGVPCTGNPFD